MTEKEAYIQDLTKVVRKLLATTATDTQNGVMSAEDKRILNSLASAAALSFVKCTYEEYKDWKAQGKLDADTFYAITNIVDDDEAKDVLGG